MIPIKDTVPSRNVLVAIPLLLISNLVVFLFLEFGFSLPIRRALLYCLGIVPISYTQPEWLTAKGLPVSGYWSFLTSLFIHGNWLHIIANMWTLWIFGDNVEDRMGPWGFLLFYLLCGIAAGLVHCLANPYATIPAVGASGAIAGVMGAYFFMFPRAQVIVLLPVFFYPLFMQLPAVTYLGLWLITQILYSLSTVTTPYPIMQIAWWAHIGGFVAGALFHWFFLRPRKQYPTSYPDECGIESGWVDRYK